MNVCVYPCLSYTACRSHLFCAALYCYLSPVWLYHIFPYYLTNDMISWRNALNVKCLFFLYKFCPKPFPFWEEFIERLSWMYIGLHVNYPLFLSDFNEIWVFLTDFWEILTYQISWKSVHWEPNSLIQTDMNPTVALCNYANVLRNGS
jgi:hypothetical protein